MVIKRVRLNSSVMMVGLLLSTYSIFDSLSMPATTQEKRNEETEADAFLLGQ
uniref:Uncharacterized protein n=1 Tax=Arundo donax TaxID=35708 RepID=A0A0A9AVJ1_ARUDO